MTYAKSLNTGLYRLLMGGTVTSKQIKLHHQWCHKAKQANHPDLIELSPDI